ncbi:hypothetical protein BC830DRAFT_1142244 [Chytriomyces sp. MP71]|nr:hypothetical protein BC830DRAFT_1142244 [Chytriomyces sp. MP71]
MGRRALPEEGNGAPPPLMSRDTPPKKEPLKKEVRFSFLGREYSGSSPPSTSLETFACLEVRFAPQRPNPADVLVEDLPAAFPGIATSCSAVSLALVYHWSASLKSLDGLSRGLRSKPSCNSKSMDDRIFFPPPLPFDAPGLPWPSVRRCGRSPIVFSEGCRVAEGPRMRPSPRGCELDRDADML